MNIKKSKKNMNFMPYLILLIVVFGTYLFINTAGTKINKLDYNQFTTELSSGKVTELNVRRIQKR